MPIIRYGGGSGSSIIDAMLGHVGFFVGCELLACVHYPFFLYALGLITWRLVITRPLCIDSGVEKFKRTRYMHVTGGWLVGRATMAAAITENSNSRMT